MPLRAESDNVSIERMQNSNEIETEMKVGRTQQVKDVENSTKLVVMKMVQSQVKIAVDALVALSQPGQSVIKAISATNVISDNSTREINSNLAISTKSSIPERMYQAVQGAPWTRRRSIESTTRRNPTSQYEAAAVPGHTEDVIITDDDSVEGETDLPSSGQRDVITSNENGSILKEEENFFRPILVSEDTRRISAS